MRLHDHKLSRKRLLQLFTVDLRDGRLFWKSPSKYHSEKIGREAGNIQPHHSGSAYWVVSIDGRKYRRGRLIFMIATGKWANPCIDHINGNALDDRPSNLREATVAENARNRKKVARRIDLPMGVRLIPHSGRFEARISFDSRQFHLGAFDTPQEAEAVYLAKRKELFGDFA